MQHRNQQQESHLTEIIRLLSTYHALTLLQLEAFYPELTHQKLLLLLKKAGKGRAAYPGAGKEPGPVYRELCPKPVHPLRFLGASGFPGGHYLSYGQ